MRNILMLLLDIALVVEVKRVLIVSGTIRVILRVRTNDVARAARGDVNTTMLTSRLSLRRRGSTLPEHQSSRGSSQRGPLLWVSLRVTTRIAGVCGVSEGGAGGV